jgi:hypothetical protein
MKKLIISALAIGSLFAQTNSTDLQKQIEELKAKLKKVENMAIENQKKVNPIAANNHLYWSLDIRSALDIISYKLSNGKSKSNNILTNRVTLTGVAKPSDNLKATLKIQANNIFGMDGIQDYNILGHDNSNWTANETPDDTTIRVKEAFFNYFFGPNNALMFSAGRRPATEGYPANYRAGDEHANSPLAHLINLEFDGFSFQIGNDALAEISDKFSDWGTWLKICAGRGYSPNTGRFSTYPYSKGDKNLQINDFAGFIFVPYDDGQYSLWTETIKAWNVQGYIYQGDKNGNGKPDLNKYTMKTVGDYFGFNAVFKANGIGEDLGDFFDNTNAFISFAYTLTIPQGNRMLGTKDNKSGTSWWIGADMPVGETNDRWGFNYVHGSKYYRAMTYAEDTFIGSIAAVRGNAYEVYYHHQIIPHLTLGARATLIKYDYTGSEAFFGDFGAPMDIDSDQAKAMGAIKDAKNIRVYIRYNF